MQITARCPKCDAGLPVDVKEQPDAIKCGRCGTTISIDLSDAVRGDLEVDRCPVCSGSDFYRRKDFDPKVGVTVVVIGAAISAGFYWYGRDLTAYSILAGVALIDLVVYGRLKDLTVCYRSFRVSWLVHSDGRGLRPAYG